MQSYNRKEDMEGLIKLLVVLAILWYIATEGDKELTKQGIAEEKYNKVWKEIQERMKNNGRKNHKNH